MAGTWACLIPFILVIPISIITKQVQSGLFVGLLVGSYLLHPSWLGGIEHMVNYLISNIVVINNIRIIVFLYSFAGLVGIIKLTGGIKGFVHLISKKVKTKKGAMLLAWLSTFGTFSEPDFRIVTIAPIMKALSKRLDLSKQKIAYAIEFTANPVIALIPIATAFVGYMVSIIGQALKTSGIDQPAYTVYVKSIPFNFFSIVIILVGIYYSFFKKQKEDVSLEKTEKNGHPPSLKHHKNVETSPQHSGVLLSSGPSSFNMETGTISDIHGEHTGMHERGADEQADQQEELDAAHRAYIKETPIRPWNLMIPIALFLLLTLFLSWWDGHSKAKGFFNAFIKSDMLGVMLTALLAAVIAAFALFMFQRFSAGELVTHFIKGGNELVNVIIMLSLIWAVTAVSEDLGFSTYITSHLTSWIPHMFIAPSLFILGAVISYFIGSSWGTWGLLMPLGVTLAVQSHTSLLLVIGAVFASGTFGAFASPLSDNTVTTCTVLGIDVVKYARSKLVPALIAAGISVVLYGAFSFFR
ncbi:sodium:proton antiporter [Bacillus nakamurai]|uniref:Na+/H+ antiporter NhaC family protein n=1 Tax=Bacillus nakamurai TaxID=1793963 RepID=UPI00077835A7|nr:Na+/H+ antiporter NhaC family protein [Bacillus nakamurai]KXZ23913.1 sodium:proton antiporter [Bacillus nakamurai]MCP6684140.1 sodium:proton antiporter [Bacillus nakamurai]